MSLDAYDFDLPEALIALRPVYPRDEARLLVVHGNGKLEDRQIVDLPSFLAAGDALVVNDTKVIKAALTAVRRARDGTPSQDVEVTLNLLERLSSNTWRILARPGKRLQVGDRLIFDDATVVATVVEKCPDGQIDIVFSLDGDELDTAIDQLGDMPLPPYIARRRKTDEKDIVDYQTRFADQVGSVAAPTAGLHFTDRLQSRLTERGIHQHTVTLHVGAGTFAPLKEADVNAGVLHAEWRSISHDTASSLNVVKSAGKRIIAVGTTSLRTLESSVNEGGELFACTGETDIFIQPGYQFRYVDGLMTNFHLPRSSLFMLVSAMMGTEVMQAAYAHAIAEKYRFYSYGDACLLMPSHD